MFDESECRVVEKLDDQGRLKERTWKSSHSDAPHRQDGPAIEKFEPTSGKLIFSLWINQTNGGIHREGSLPAFIQIDSETGVVHNEEYYVSGIQDRLGGGPTKILRNRKSGQIVELEYRIDGWFEREGDLPAYVQYHDGSEQVARFEYYRGGVLHRDNGPAVVEFDRSGLVTVAKYYQRGKELSGSVPAPRLGH